MHVLAPRPSNAFIPIFFNVDTSVGQNGSNSNKEDILLVQFLIHKTAEAPGAQLSQERRDRMLKVKTSGKVDDATIDGIKAVQETMNESRPGTIIDGKVSPARGYQYGAGFWTIVSMNSSLRRHFPNKWPRLQDFTDCPDEVKKKAKEVL
jgi:hypothetical protein